MTDTKFNPDKNSPSSELLEARKRFIELIEKGDAKEVNNILASNKNMANFTLENNYTPLMVAARCGHQEIVKSLLESSGNKVVALLSTDNEGKTALMHAAEYGHTAVITTLLNGRSLQVRQDYINVKNKLGNTAENLAETNKHLDSLIALLQAKSSSAAEATREEKLLTLEQVEEKLRSYEDSITLELLTDPVTLGKETYNRETLETLYDKESKESQEEDRDFSFSTPNRVKYTIEQIEAHLKAPKNESIAEEAATLSKLRDKLAEKEKLKQEQEPILMATPPPGAAPAATKEARIHVSQLNGSMFSKSKEKPAEDKLTLHYFIASSIAQCNKYLDNCEESKARGDTIRPISQTRQNMAKQLIQDLGKAKGRKKVIALLNDYLNENDTLTEKARYRDYGELAHLLEQHVKTLSNLYYGQDQNMKNRPR